MPSRRSTVTMSSADGSGFSALASLEPEANLQLKQHPAPLSEHQRPEVGGHNCKSIVSLSARVTHGTYRWLVAIRPACDHRREGVLTVSPLTPLSIFFRCVCSDLTLVSVPSHSRRLLESFPPPREDEEKGAPSTPPIRDASPFEAADVLPSHAHACGAAACQRWGGRRRFREPLSRPGAIFVCGCPLSPVLCLLQCQCQPACGTKRALVTPRLSAVDWAMPPTRAPQRTSA